tara:strand:- start:106 stop:330 length:225 start_codon:yes stop_codon:yes gene_type:complete
MSNIYETDLNDQEEQDDIFYKKYPYYWLVKAYRINVDVYSHWEEWSETLSELLENIKYAHKKQLKVRIERFKRT